MRNLPVFSGLALLVLFLLHNNNVETIASRDQLNSAMSPATFTEPAVAPDTLFFCVENGNAELPDNNQYFLGEEHADATACSVHIWSTRSLTDPCGGNVTFDVKLYLHPISNFVQVVDPTVVALDKDNYAALHFDTRSTSLPADHPIALSGVPYTGDLCEGSDVLHRLHWTIVNDCGDTTTYTSDLRVEDCYIPRPICVGLSSVVLPSSGSVTIWAKDFDSGVSGDDCTKRDDLLYSFSETSYQPSRVFDCPTIFCDGPSYQIEMWVADNGRDLDCNGFVQPLGIEWHERSKDYCSTFIVFDDNEGVCECGHGPFRITSPGGAGIADVRVDFVFNNDTVYHVFTDEDGYYDSNGFLNPLLTTIVIPSKDDDPKNGVSTLDLVLIQKHLLGFQLFETPYELIAADANNSESVSALDLVEIRKLILGLYTEFPKNKSWRFIAQPDSFPNLFNPWPFEEIQINQGLDFNGDFIGVKIGDINGSVVTNANQVVMRGTRKLLMLQIEDLHVKAGDQVSVPVYGENFNDILGFQFTMQTAGLEFTGIERGEIDMQYDYVAQHEGAITMSWANLVAFAAPASVEADKALFTLTFTATANGRLSNMLKLTSDITEAEAYVQKSGSGDEQVLSIGLQFAANKFTGSGFALHQNEPNPFSDQTTIGVEILDAMQGTLTIYDVHGCIVSRTDHDFTIGYNAVPIHRDQLGPSGVYHYRLDAGKLSAVNKLVLFSE